MSTEDRLLAWLDRAVDRAAALSARVPVLIDSALVALLLAISFVGMHRQDRLGLQTVLFGAGLALPLLLRRRYPALTFAIVALVGFLQWLFSPPQLADAAILLSLYWVARDSGILLVLAAAVTVEAGAVAAVLRWTVVDQPKVLVGLTGLGVAASVLGISMRQRRALLQSLHDRAARLELERDQEGQASASAERARIAREMHDIVSHNLTVMIALADGAEYTMNLTPERALPAVHRISTTGREALHEMRRLLGVLHDEPSAEPLEPQPSLARLDELVARVEAAGVPVEVELDGELSALSEGVQLAVFRVTQEALTNTLKHAIEPRQARVVLHCGRGRGPVTLDISDDGRQLATVGGEGTARLGDSSHSGRGLHGMRERAAAYGGMLEAGPLADGGWHVRLQLPA